jgi:DNA helicase-2/ATP-dependent DNA helicase PcrA
VSIYELSFADIAKVKLEGVVDFEADKDPIETNDSAWAERVRFKSTLDFVKQMDSFIAQMPGMVFEPADYTYGRFTAKADTISARFMLIANILSNAFADGSRDIFDRFDTDNYMEEDIPKSRTIQKALSKILKVKDTLSLYKEFYKHIERPEMLVMPAKKTLEWADVFPLIYLHAAYEGLKESGIFRHLVIDEMQDYTLSKCVINRCLYAQKLFLGISVNLSTPTIYIH